MALNSRAFIITSSIYILLLLLLVYTGFTSKYMIPSEEGILVNFGQDDAGFGEIEPMFTEKVVKEKEPAEQLELPVIEKKEQVITQDYEDAPSIDAETEKPQLYKPRDQRTVTTNTEPVEKPQPNQSAMWGKNRNTSSTASEGIVPGGTGNQGSPGGDINSKDYSPGGGFGNGISATLEGRESVSLPKPPKMSKEGVVVVEVTVDKNGRVINAVAGIKGSTTLDSQLKEAARSAALASRFTSKEDAPESQKGKIVYYFRFK